MAKQAHIVDFEEARRQSARRASRTSGAQAEDRLERYSRSASSRVASPAQMVRQRQHDARKRKAERAYERAVKPAEAPSDDAPRAALYRGQASAQQRRTGQMQERSERELRSAGRGGGLPVPRLSRALRVPLALFAVVALAALFLYAPARDYYVSVRDQARAEAELAVLQQRNNELNAEIVALSTDQGIEDRARAEYGWVMPGENAVIVTGLDSDGIGSADGSDITSATDVPAPETWYSGVLDPLFGYDK